MDILQFFDPLPRISWRFSPGILLLLGAGICIWAKYGKLPPLLVTFASWITDESIQLSAPIVSLRQTILELWKHLRWRVIVVGGIVLILVACLLPEENSSRLSSPQPPPISRAGMPPPQNEKSLITDKKNDTRPTPPMPTDLPAQDLQPLDSNNPAGFARSTTEYSRTVEPVIPENIPVNIETPPVKRNDFGKAPQSHNLTIEPIDPMP